MIASADDFRRFYDGMDPPAIWLGVTDGKTFGSVVWDAEGRAWAFVDKRGRTSAVKMHRAARRVLAALREAGEKELRAFCDDTPEARRWLERLGFENDGGVWICRV